MWRRNIYLLEIRAHADCNKFYIIIENQARSQALSHFRGGPESPERILPRSIADGGWITCSLNLSPSIHSPVQCRQPALVKRWRFSQRCPWFSQKSAYFRQTFLIRMYLHWRTWKTLMWHWNILWVLWRSGNEVIRTIKMFLSRCDAMNYQWRFWTVFCGMPQRWCFP